MRGFEKRPIGIENDFKNDDLVHKIIIIAIDFGRKLRIKF